jgi:hypothetical protein
LLPLRAANPSAQNLELGPQVPKMLPRGKKKIKDRQRRFPRTG